MSSKKATRSRLVTQIFNTRSWIQNEKFSDILSKAEWVTKMIVGLINSIKKTAIAWNGSELKALNF